MTYLHEARKREVRHGDVETRVVGQLWPPSPSKTVYALLASFSVRLERSWWYRMYHYNSIIMLHPADKVLLRFVFHELFSCFSSNVYTR